jgi:hypothetical protein
MLADPSCLNFPVLIGATFRKRVGAHSYCGPFKLLFSIAKNSAFHTSYAPPLDRASRNSAQPFAAGKMHLQGFFFVRARSAL